MFKTRLYGVTAGLTLTLGGCAIFSPPKMDMPEKTVVEQKAPSNAQALAMMTPTGSLYSPATYTPMFEDIRARRVGDVLTIQINENTDASQTNAMEAKRSDAATMALPSFNLPLLGRTTALDSQASGTKTFSGDGKSKAANTLTGTLTVTVSDVLPNGNLRVVGEKQIGTNREVQTLKFSGVVNPVTIRAGNVVSSNQVADARVAYSGEGSLDAATTMGWLSRFFLSVLPF